jgi:hypothetical protein
MRVCRFRIVSQVSQLDDFYARITENPIASAIRHEQTRLTPSDHDAPKHLLSLMRADDATPA